MAMENGDVPVSDETAKTSGEAEFFRFAIFDKVCG